VAGLSGFVAIVNPAGAGQALAASADGTRLVSAGYSYSGGAPPDLVLGQIMISTNAGASWGPTSAPANAWQAVASSADGTKLAATDSLGWGGDGLIYTSTNSGASWAPTVAPASVWLSIASSADGATLVAAAINYFYISTNSGAAWVSADAPAWSWGAIACSGDASTIVAASYGGPVIGILRARAPAPPPPSPVLSVGLSGLGLGLSWLVPSSIFVVQQSSDLASTNWVDVIAAKPTLNLTNLHNELALPRPPGSTFYRLKQQ
jgi:hypothetical protein